MSRSKFRRKYVRCGGCGQRVLDEAQHRDPQRDVYLCVDPAPAGDQGGEG